MRSLPKTSLMLLRWSLHDKKRAEEILCDFTTLNGDVHEKIKLLCLASDLGLNIQHRIEHFQRLQSDESSIKLGFSTDATLRLAAPDLQASSDTLELSNAWEGSLRIAPPARGGFGLIEHEGIKYLLEHRPCDLDERTRLRLEELARLLAQPKEISFCMPHCIGWKKIPDVQQVGFVFDIPPGASPRPTSLFRLLDTRNVRLSLGQRFRLSVALARCISQLQMVKWVHESFRSENILFFPQSNQIQESTYDYGKPLVLGFESSRPEVDFSSGFADICLERDVYRHPERQGRPGKMFNKTHDIYALGMYIPFLL